MQWQAIASNKRIVLAILSVLIVTGLALAVSYKFLPVIGVEGIVDVEEEDTGIMSSELIIIRLNITVPEGEARYENVTSFLVAPGEAVKISVIESSVEGNVSIALSGVATLKGENESYRIHLPCMVVNGIPCTRILTLIPGYDTPLHVAPGVYSVDLELEWRARGKGRFEARLVIERKSSAYTIRVIGVEPESIENWVIAPGSTRSYALAVEKTRIETGDDDIGVVKAYAWTLSSSTGNTSTIFTFKLVDAEGRVLAKLKTKPFTDDMYHRLLVEIKAPRGEYILRFEASKLGEPLITALEIPLEFR